MQYLIVTEVNKTWTTEFATEEEIINGLTKSGATSVNIKASRRTNDYSFLEVDGYTIAKLFTSQALQMRYLAEIGLIG